MLLCMNCFREERVKKDVDLSKLEEWLNREHKESQKEKNARLAKLHGIPLNRLKGKSLGSRKVIRPTYEQFLKEMKKLNWNYSAMGRKYGVSDNAIRRWKKSYETETH